MGILLSEALDRAVTVLVVGRYICPPGLGDSLYVEKGFDNGAADVEREVGRVVVAAAVVGFGFGKRGGGCCGGRSGAGGGAGGCG